MATPDQIRANAILKDIYARHSIPEGTDPITAMQMVQAASEGSWGSQPSAWANPDERAAAREQYALRGGDDPNAVQKRWDESVYLVDPETDKYQQNYGRDTQFLGRMAEGMVVPPTPPTFWDVLKSGGTVPDSRNMNREYALQKWDQSNSSPLYRDNFASSGWEQQDSTAGTVVNAISNPDLAGGKGMNAMNIPYEFLAMQGSGEAKTTGDSWRTAVGNYKTLSNNRLGTPAPILDLPSNATVQERAARLKELQEQASAGAVPDSAERWKRSLGVVPPPVIRDAGDAFLATLDGTQLIPGMAVGKTVAKNAARSAAKGVARDMTSDAITSTAIAAGLNAKPERTWPQYLGFAPEPEGSVQFKSDDEVDAANAARKQQFERSLQQYGAGVSTADDEAYKRLQQAGKVRVRNQ